MILALSLCGDGKSEITPGSRAYQLVGKLARGRAERPIPPADQRDRWMRLGRLGLVHPDRRPGRGGYRLRDEGDAEPGVDQFADAGSHAYQLVGKVARRPGVISDLPSLQSDKSKITNSAARRPCAWPRCVMD